MKKKYFWIKVAVLIGSSCLFLYGLISSNAMSLGLCYVESHVRKCVINYDVNFGPLIFISIYTLLISPMMFFISEKIFKKWLIFTAIWLVIDVLLIMWAPVTSSYYFGGPTKESVSIWMGTFFVIISILMFVILTIKERKTLKK